MTLLIAGATGDLGGRISRVLLEKGATVRALIRPDTDPAKASQLAQIGVETVRADVNNKTQLARACEGVDGVVSAVQGLHDVIVEAQSRLLEAALMAGVPRFIPSDFATDFTRLPDGVNRNFDLRREFKQTLDQAPIRATSILNGAFADLLRYNMPLLNFQKQQVGYWDDADWRLDFTTKDNTAAYTAAAALDTTAPRLLRIASFQISANELARAAEQATGKPFRIVRLGSREELAADNRRARAADPEGEKQLYPRWQQSQYLYSMFNVQNDSLDNDRYPDIRWDDVQTVLASRASHRN